ncbi:MAG: alpha/beta hydrolase [Candidatus Protistobacter heckmanni]|nr:alpha/beta hydrolase [Candidatus Protistobacter heckmanni]
MTALLPAIETATGDTATFSIIWMHGLGADGSDFAPIVPELELYDRAGVRFVFPHAPSIPLTCNGGYMMPAWYDIFSLDVHNRSVDESGIVRSRESIRALIARENERGVPSSRIFLAGFSQGGAIAYSAGFTHPEPLAGVIALSTYIPSPTLVENEATEVNKTLPVFAGHGGMDNVVSVELGLRASDLALRLGHPVEWRDYPMQHSVCPEEIHDIGAWLRARMAAIGG